MPPFAAAPGWSFADPYAIGLVFAAVAVFAAIGALTHQGDRAFSASVIYLLLGLTAALGIEVLGVGWVDPIDDAGLFERTSELAVIVALFATGLKLDRPMRWADWRVVVRLLAITMPVTIGLLTLFGTQAMGLSLGAALVLAASLAPTDPVLAGDLGVGPPGEEDESEPHFSITGEAGLNDGLAFPFTLLGIVIVADGAKGSVAEWLVADVLWAIVAGVVLGALIGHGTAAGVHALRNRRLTSTDLDGFFAVAAVLLVYGVTEVAGAYGFLAAFVGGLAFRRHERHHELNQRVHGGAEVVEKFGELALVLLVGSTVTIAGLQAPGVAGWALVVVAILVVRPLATAIGLLGSGLPAGEQRFLGWFGVRGIGSVYYASAAIGLGVLSDAEALTVFWTTIATVLVSILVHGISASPLSRRWMG